MATSQYSLELRMRRLFAGLFLLAFGVIFIAIAKPAATVFSAGSPAALEKELKDADLEFARQTAARRLEGWMDFFADDAATIHDGKTVTGKQALRAYYEPVFADKDFTLVWTPAKAEAAKDGTLGYTYGDYEAKEGTKISHGMYVTAWRRINGKWKVVLDLGSAAPAH
jgi:ketosteroid isomerase-like protein